MEYFAAGFCGSIVARFWVEAVSLEWLRTAIARDLDEMTVVACAKGWDPLSALGKSTRNASRHRGNRLLGV